MAFEALAGGSPTGYVVIYNPSDPRSVTIANRYQQVRGIPERNMLPYAFPTSFSRTTAWDFAYWLRQTLTTRGLDAQFQGIALAGITPLDGAQHSSGNYVFSIQSFIFLSPNYSHANFPANATVYHNAYTSPSNIYGLAPTGTVALTPAMSYSGQHYWPISAVGFPGKAGNTTREILDLIDRSKAHDAAKPAGTIYWPLNSDIRSKTREPEIGDVDDVWTARGINYVVTGSATNSNPWIYDRNDIVGGIVGIAVFTVNADTFLPGAWVDHLTSCGGILDSFNPGQTTVAEWLRAGVDGSSGTMGEPYAIAAKFPHAHIHTHFRAGASLAEAFWHSLQQPAEIVCVGDPLLQPYADFPVVTVTSPTDGATVSGTLTISATATPTGNKTLEPGLELFVDGLRTNAFTLDTTALADGWHELRVVAYNADPVRTQNEAKFSVIVNNTGQSITLTGPATVNPDASTNFTVTPVGITDLASLTLQANGRTLTNAPLAGGAVALSGALAPLTNDWILFAVGTRSNGQQIWSAPFTTTVSWAAMPASNAVLGGAMADVRVFLTTTNSGFNWDTATPDAVTNFPGDPTYGLYITNAPFAGLTISNYATRPGFDLKLWFYAPVDDWYEVGFDASYTQSRACILDGLSLTDRNTVFGPRRLAPGWHALRVHTAFNDSRWSYWKVKLRGGTSQDFVNFTRAATANDGTGNPPTILSLTPSASPVTSTKVTLTAGATISGGSSGDLTYHWTMLGGPRSVAFSTNSAPGINNTTGTFTLAGNYVFGLRVATATDSAATSLPVTVQQTVSGITLSTGLYNASLQGAPFDLFAFTKDQFGRRIEITPTTNGMPTIQWTVTDATGTFTLDNTSGEEAAYRSLLALLANTNVTITATGINGRTGSASVTLTVTTNTPPTATGSHLFTINQTSAGQPISFTASVNDPESSAGNWHAPLLAYNWLALGLTLTTNIAGQATAGCPAPGTYTVQLTVTDQAGATTSETQSFTVDVTGKAYYAPTLSGPYNTTVHAGANANFSVSSAQPIICQWQISTNTGASWLDLASATNTSLSFGPVTGANNSNQFRVACSTIGGTTTSRVATLTVNDPASGIISIVGNWSQFVTEDAGTITITVRRSGQSSGAVSVDWDIYDGDALLGEDYDVSPASGTFTWADGDTSDRTVTVSIINDAVVEDEEYFYIWLSSIQGGASYGARTYQYIYIEDDDGPGSAAFTTSALTVKESDGAATLTVRRDFPYAGTLTVDYATKAGTATPGQNYVDTSGTLTWPDGDSTDKTISIPLINDPVIRSNLQFTVNLTSTNDLWIGFPSTATVTIQDAPYQKWQQTWWPSAVPAVAAYNDLPTAIRSFNPLFYFRFSELTGSNLFGNGATGVLTGSYTLAWTGPRPPGWPGLESTNVALNLAASGSTGTPPQFSSGASAFCGIANGIGTNLGRGFTFAGFVNTTVTNRQMFLAGGARVGSTNTALSITLNRAFNNNTSCVPHTLRLYVRPEAVSGRSLEYSVTFTNHTTGSLCDGQWHHIAITQPMFSNTDYAEYPHFYFDGTEVNTLNVRGTENITGTNTFSDFSDIGFRLGADGSAAPAGFYSGAMDEVAFFTSVLSAGGVSNLAAARPPSAMPSYTGDFANPAGDGIVNLTKYALNLNPLAATNAGLPSFSLNGTNFNFSFTRLRDATDINYIVEGSGDLRAWTQFWDSVSAPYPGSALSTNELLNFDVSDEPQGFFRLRLRRP